MRIKSVEVRKSINYKKPRIFIFPPEYTAIENLFNRRNRPYQEWRKFIPKALRMISKKEKLSIPSDVKARWSQKAGCSCGCSPGFILDCEPNGKNIFVTLT